MKEGTLTRWSEHIQRGNFVVWHLKFVVDGPLKLAADNASLPSEWEVAGSRFCHQKGRVHMTKRGRYSDAMIRVVQV